MADQDTKQGGDGARQHAMLQGLNTAQRMAVTCKTDVVAILAGPGSGKTHTLTARVAWLVEQAGYAPQDIIVATFTVKAAREMKERITRSLGEERAQRLVVGTFHSIARRYISVYGHRIGIPNKFSIVDDSDTKAILKRICNRLGLRSLETPALREWISNRKVRSPEYTAVVAKQQAGQAISLSQTQNKAQFEEDAIRVFTEYQDHLERSDLLDYDDLLVKGVELLDKFPACVRNVQTVLIDEYQDTNHIQFRLMKHFANARGRITIVGDPDQSIYGWRSADIKNFENLFRDYPDHIKIALEENYRSSGSIVQSSLDVIRQDSERIEKTLTPTHRHGVQPVLRKLKTNTTEGEWIVEELQRVTTLSGGMLKYEDCAILIRSAYLSRQVESALGRAGISYRMIGGLKFYERLEIKVLLDYLRVIYQPDNNDALVRIINTPKRGVGETTLKNLLEEAESEKRSLWEILFLQFRGNKRPLKTKLVKPAPQMLSAGLIRIISGLRHRLDRAERDALSSQFSLTNLIEELIRELDFIGYIKKSYPQEHDGRLANIQEFMTLVGDFIQEHQVGEDLPEIDGIEQTTETGLLGKFLTNVALATDAQTGEDEDLSSTVTISTIHAAKGLEWPVIFVPAVYNGSLPHSRSDNDEEERRLLYVAMTRAKALLYLSCPLYKGQYKSGESLSSEDTELELSDFIPDKIAKKLREKGPVFEQRMINEMARILGREAPSLDKVFRELPPNLPFNIVDENFPTNPKEAKRGPTGSRDHYGHSQKRQKVYSAQNPFVGQAEEKPWRKEYATTMEQSSRFTMAATMLPGFTTAGAHQTALAKVPSEVSRRPKGAQGPGRPQSSTLRGAPQQTHGQRSLYSFAHGQGGGRASPETTGQVAGGADSGNQVPPAPITHPGQVQASFNKPLDRAIIEEATRRGLQHVRRRVQARSDQQRRDSDGGTASAGASSVATAYPNFSSPPPKLATSAGLPVGKMVSSASETTTNSSTSISISSNNNNHNNMSSSTDQPASCLHATTMASSASGPVSGAIRRPPALNRASMAGGVAPLDKLRKPFQPLSVSRDINRPAGSKPAAKNGGVGRVSRKF